MSGVEFIPAVKLREIYRHAATSHSDDNVIDDVIRDDVSEHVKDDDGQRDDDGGNGGVYGAGGSVDGADGGVHGADGSVDGGVGGVDEGGSVGSDGGVDGADGGVDGGVGGAGGSVDGAHGGIGNVGGVIVGGSVSRRGTELSLVRLRLCDGAVTLLASHLTLLVSCGRCRGMEQVELTAGQLYSVRCSRCQSSLLLQFDAAIAHHLSSLIGFINVNQCRPVDIILSTSSFLVGCTSCNSDAAINVRNIYSPPSLKYGLRLYCQTTSLMFTRIVSAPLIRFHDFGVI